MSVQNQSERYDDITYDKGFKKASQSVRYVRREEEAEPEKVLKEPREKKPFRFLLLAVQLIVCAVILAAAMILKQLGLPQYDYFKEFYTENLNNSLFETPKANLLDLNEIFSDSEQTEPSGESEQKTLEETASGEQQQPENPGSDESARQ